MYKYHMIITPPDIEKFRLIELFAKEENDKLLLIRREIEALSFFAKPVHSEVGLYDNVDEVKNKCEEILKELYSGQ